MKFLDVPQSGSIAGVTHSHNRAGQYTRSRRSPVQPIGTGRRAQVRAAFAAASAGFRSLTTAQQDAWTSFAAGHPVTDSLGQSVILTGHQMYVRCSATAQNTLNTPLAVPPLPDAIPALGSPTMSFGVVAGIEVDWSGSAGPGWVCLAYSRPVSSGVRFIKTFWQPPSTPGVVDATASPGSLTTALYAAQFGAPVPGQQVFCRLTPVSSDFFNGPPVIISCTVGA